MTNALAVFLTATNCIMFTMPTNTTHTITSTNGIVWATNAWPSNASCNIVGVVGTNEMRLLSVKTNESK